MPINVIPKNQGNYDLAVKNFWRKQCSMNKSDSPAWHNHGQKDSVFNAGSQFFNLSFDIQGPSNRETSVPQGKGLLIPIVSVEASDAEWPGASDQFLLQLVTTDESHTVDLFVELDGTPFDLTGFEVNTDVFDVNFPNDAIFPRVNPPGEIAAGPSRAAAGGHYLLTEPLSPGPHTVRFGGKVRAMPPPPCIQENYTEDVRYTLSV
jgi:hypothetical protein